MRDCIDERSSNVVMVGLDTTSTDAWDKSICPTVRGLKEREEGVFLFATIGKFLEKKSKFFGIFLDGLVNQDRGNQGSNHCSNKIVVSGFDGKAPIANELGMVLKDEGQVESPSSIGDYRPTNLCNVMYKITSKVLVSRLKPHMNALVSTFQNGFVHGRGAQDKIIMAQELIHTIRTSKCKKIGMAAIKIDMTKAFDRIRWDFLLKLLETLRFRSSGLN
ncbi:hypothetical protein LIER_38382 [Lithospermum erythrorhizon]|uniref:Reverse transcriptase domain-containing protein n=1 Tax=Lithospermum erythrorhizon TaxID=34254 RepID=A0AAV3Q441_LITER